MQQELTRISATVCSAKEPAGRAVDLEAQLDVLMSRLRLAVIFGGDKSAPGGVIFPSGHTRSWKSYEAVAGDIAESLSRIGFRHVHLMPDDMLLGERLRREGIHMAWLNTGGVQGCNPAAHAPAMLEMFGIPYVGHDSLSATTLDNKHAFKREALCAGLPTAPFVTWHMARGPFRPELNDRFRRAFGQYAGPFVVKPVSGRASLHVHVVDRSAELADVVNEVYGATGNLVLIEKYLPGREVCIAVAGPVISRQRRLVRGNNPFTFAAIERVLSADERIFTSMDIRPITAERCHGLDPEKDAGLLEQMHEIARAIFLEFNLGSLVRIDLRADQAGKLFILEANPKPDLKAPAAGVTSLVAAGLRDTGMDYDDLILSLLADRLDYLLMHRRDSIRHVVELIGLGTGAAKGPRFVNRSHAGTETATQAYRRAAVNAGLAEEQRAALDEMVVAAAESADKEAITSLAEAATDASVEALDAVRRPAAARARTGT